MRIRLFLPFFTLFFFLIHPAISEEKAPFVWIVEKEGKVSYLLGTVHVGVSLLDMPCSNEILNQIQNSDLIFLERKFGDDNEKLNREEERKVFIGSKKEQEDILSRLSFESQEVIRERKAALDNILRSLYGFHVQSDVTEGAFSELRPESQELLIKYGVDPEGNHADFFHFIRFIVHNESYFHLPPLDDQVERVAVFLSIKVRPLDDNKKINEDFDSQAPPDKPIQRVGYKDIEQRISKLGILVRGQIRAMLHLAQIYTSYDIDHFKELFEKEEKGVFNEEILLRNRNELWLQKFIEAQAEYENIFLAAGVRHFIGSYNLLDMLEDNGFSIERMTCSVSLGAMWDKILDSLKKMFE